MFNNVARGARTKRIQGMCENRESLLGAELLNHLLPLVQAVVAPDKVGHETRGEEG